MITFLRFAALFMLAAVAHNASAINCKLSAGHTEELICKDSQLIVLDDSLNRIYRAALGRSADPTKIKADQRRWIAETRAACTTSVCLKEIYESRLLWLATEMRPWCQSQRARLAGYWKRVGDAGFFEQFSAGPDGEFDSWLHQRPEISGGTWDLVECRFVVMGPSGMMIDYILTDVTKSEMRAVEVGVGLVRYRRSVN